MIRTRSRNVSLQCLTFVILPAPWIIKFFHLIPNTHQVHCQKIKLTPRYCLLGMGSTALIYQPGTASMEMGSSQVNAGTAMTGLALFTSISNALTSLCPTPTSPGAWTICETGVIEVGSATYLDPATEERSEGTVTVKVTDAQYNATNFHDLFINMIASAANASATGNNCNSSQWEQEIITKRDEGGGTLTKWISGTDIWCNMNGFLDTQFYDGVQETAKMWLEAEVRQLAIIFVFSLSNGDGAFESSLRISITRISICLPNPCLQFLLVPVLNSLN